MHYHYYVVFPKINELKNFVILINYYWYLQRCFKKLYSLKLLSNNGADSPISTALIMESFLDTNFAQLSLNFLDIFKNTGGKIFFLFTIIKNIKYEHKNCNTINFYNSQS